MIAPFAAWRALSGRRSRLGGQSIRTQRYSFPEERSPSSALANRCSAYAATSTPTVAREGWDGTRWRPDSVTRMSSERDFSPVRADRTDSPDRTGETRRLTR